MDIIRYIVQKYTQKYDKLTQSVVIQLQILEYIAAFPLINESD